MRLCLFLFCAGLVRALIVSGKHDIFDAGLGTQVAIENSMEEPGVRPSTDPGKHAYFITRVYETYSRRRTDVEYRAGPRVCRS